jgi:hypothetical protein
MKAQRSKMRSHRRNIRVARVTKQAAALVIEKQEKLLEMYRISRESKSQWTASQAQARGQGQEILTWVLWQTKWSQSMQLCTHIITEKREIVVSQIQIIEYSYKIIWEVRIEYRIEIFKVKYAKSILPPPTGTAASRERMRAEAMTEIIKLQKELRSYKRELAAAREVLVLKQQKLKSITIQTVIIIVQREIVIITKTITD